MPTFRGIIAYDGSGYFGFQRQAHGTPTIQGEVERAIADITGQTVTVIGAGRTDSGVHATGQVIAFTVEWAHADAALHRAINAALPDAIALQSFERVPDDQPFHPRFDAVSRRYQYSVVQAAHRQPLLRDRAWRVSAPLDLDVMQSAAAALVGTHDFGAFGKAPIEGGTTVRTILQSAWTWADDPDMMGANVRRLVYTVEANAFLQHMVRRIVGALVDVGRGTRRRDEFDHHRRGVVLAPHWTTAPPQGLVLVHVRYEQNEQDGVYIRRVNPSVGE